MTDRQSTHADDCWSWGPKHYECALREIEALRAEVERLKSMTAVTMGVGSGDGNLFVHGDFESIKAAQAIVLERGALRAGVERLQEAVRPRREDECLTLDHWRIRAYHLEENWSRCSRACAIEQDKREQAEERAERLAEALHRGVVMLERLHGEMGPCEESGAVWGVRDALKTALARAALSQENRNG